MSYRVKLFVVIFSALLIYGIIIYALSHIHPTEKADIIYYDLEKNNIPVFIENNFIDLEKIEYIRRFRSGYGNDWSDHFESCRCMNNLFIPFDEYCSERGVKVFSPINGTVTLKFQIFVNTSGDWIQGEEDLLTWIKIKSEEAPAISIEMRCVDVRGMNIEEGTKLYAGQHIGYVSSIINNIVRTQGVDISVSVVVNSDRHIKKLSFFDVITDEVFSEYKTRGATSRDEFIISKEERDKDRLICKYDAELFTYWIYEKGNLPNWVYLGNSSDDFEIIYDFRLD